MLKKRAVIRTAGLTAAMTVMLTGVFAGSAFAAYDDMDAVSLAKKTIGKEYTVGGESMSNGFNASGLNYYVFRMIDYTMPRALDDQFKINKPFIKYLSNVKPGDVLFFGTGTNPSFSGIYIGNDKMIMASSAKDEVVVRDVDVHKSKFIGARRVLSSDDQKKVGLVLTARQYLGTPYLFGAKYGQTNTFDCSSLMKWVYNKHGIVLPRVSRDQAKEGTYVSKSNLETGDLVFFTTVDSGSRIGHVGMYVGNGMMLHTYGDGGVKYSTIESGWWKEHYVTARRVL